MRTKKIVTTFLLAILAVCLFAGDAGMNLATGLSFRSTATVGYDLDTGASGMSTVINWLNLTFTPTGYNTQSSSPPADSDAPRSFFSVSGLDMTILSSTTAYGWQPGSATEFSGISFSDLSAKLILEPVWIGVIMQGNEPSQIWNYDQFISDKAMIGTRTCYRALQDGGMGAYDLANAGWQLRQRDLFQSSYDTTGQVLIGYDHELFSVIGKIGSRNDWTLAEGEEPEHEYAFGVDASLNLISDLHIDLDAYYGLTYADSGGDPMFSVKAMYDLPLYESLILQPFVAMDGRIRRYGMNTEFSGGINIPWQGGSYQIDPIYILTDGSPNVGNGVNRFQKNNTFGGITLGTSWNIMMDNPDTPLDEAEVKSLIDLSLFEAQGDEGLYKDMGMVLTAQLYNLLGTPEYGLAAYFDIELLDDSIRPFIAGQFQNYDQEKYATAVDNLDLDIGIHYIKIPGAVIGLEYDTGNLLARNTENKFDPEWGTIYTFLAITY